MAQKINVSTVNHEVYVRLREQIMRGEIVPGEKISIRHIAEQYGVSTMPVREALRQLQAEGFVYFQRRSIIVRQLTVKEVQEIFAIRMRLETLAIEWALPNITPNNISELKEVVCQMDDDEIQYFEWHQLNQKFHLLFYEQSGSKQLNQLIKKVWDMVIPYMYIYTYKADSLKVGQKEHHDILKLVEQQKLNELLSLIADHLNRTCGTIVKELRKIDCKL
ncbi:GntR family transcriptional regulator [Aeribacillus sp. FSL M8-0254]|uniref:GntR family transcriptional regulator n=1 Tax=Aeribacillus sp. FSL M8-0254 TaxID=2954577 RepID=UPI0030F843FF